MPWVSHDATINSRGVDEQVMSTPLILVTNDDGLHSPGLHAAVEAVLPLGDVLVVAPAAQQTSMGRSMPETDGILRPEALTINGHSVPAYALNGSPALAVLLGIIVLCEERSPSLVVSGINYGENLGNGVTISGTVGAAFQAASMGIPALAVSLETDHDFHYKHGEADWTTARYFTRYFAQRVLAQTLPFDVDVLKVDIPREATPQTPWRLTRQSRHSYYQSFIKDPAPQGQLGGRLGYRVAVQPSEVEPDSDIYAFLVDRVVSVTPLSIDCTSRVDFEHLEKILRQE